MRVLSVRFLFLVVLAVLQAAQGVLAGTALCREETGSVALEWATDGQCDTPEPASASFHAGLHAEDAEGNAEHCGPCFDVPVPSETSLRSLVVSSDFCGIAPATFTFVLIEPSEALPALASLPGSLPTGHLASVRLLI